MASVDTDVAPTTLDVHRTTFVAQLEMLRTERAELLREKLSLGKKKEDGKRKDFIQARIAEIVEATDDIQEFLADFREEAQPHQAQPQQLQQQQQQQQQWQQRHREVANILKAANEAAKTA